MAHTTVISDGSLYEDKNELATTKDGNATRKTRGIPFSRKISYAVGGMPYQMTANAKGFFLQIFLLDVVQMGAFYASLILFLGRAWDAITDPLVGYMVIKSGRTRIGKLIPWIVFSMPLGVLAYIMMWFTPQESMSPSSSFFWFFIWSCLFDAFMTCYHVPYSSLNMFLWLKSISSLSSAIMSPTLHSTCSWGVTRRTETLPPATRRAYVLAALVLGGIYFLCCVVLFLGVKEQLAPLSTLDRIRMPYLAGMKMVVGHTPYVKLVFGFLFASLAFQMAQGNFALFCTHAAGLGAYFQHLVLILLTAATLSIPLWQTLLLRLGKKTTLYIGLCMYAPALVIIASIQSNLPVFIIMSIISGSSLSALYLLPWSMLPDVVDDFKVKNPTSTDLEPMFYSCYVFFNKFGGGMSVGISTLALHFAGYKPGACRQNPAVITALRVLFAPVPVVLLLIGLVLFYFYPINEERRGQIQQELQKAEKVVGNQEMEAVGL
ncbi:sodium-dependent lysophosphatidylcholine symporter 1 isoform X2 [Oncorhynchus mykiss]|uniref:sodium-dependent lysophosphatidylcholine symporter 1 isoform X2 n=1 Tax=Oncorhynchus mykiss TaxID=8022 RepID=UPI0018777F94|nr:sodium-dependent lysophosphatidylcholine symporter 1 isoform X2 [Oncorhynchus mykiss]